MDEIIRLIKANRIPEAKTKLIELLQEHENIENLADKIISEISLRIALTKDKLADEMTEGNITIKETE